MRQLDLFSSPLPNARRAIPYIVLLQSDFARTGRDRVLAPLIVRSRTPPIEWRLMPRDAIVAAPDFLYLGI